MKLFVLTYDRRRARLVRMDEFDPGDYSAANQLLFETESADPNLEVVLLEAPSIEELRRTHRRFFETLVTPPLEAAG
jgi:hypothetical protein